MSEKSSFFGFTATRPVAITMLVAAAVVFGWVGFSRLPVNLLPETTHPRVTIRTEYPGASPLDIEERVSERIQESVSVISGVRRVVSISRPEVSDVILEFAWGTEMSLAVGDIKERLDRIVLPRESDQPLVLRYDPSLDPVLTLGLAATDAQDLIDLRRYADEELKERLAFVEGVAAVKVRGGEEEEIRIAVDDAALSLYAIDIQLVGQRLAAENLNTPAGIIEEGKTEYLVRALGEFRDLDQIRNLILEHREGTAIRLSDVAHVERTARDLEVISRVNGKPCVLVDVYKEAKANVVQLCQRVRDKCFGTDTQKAWAAAGGAERAITERPADMPAGASDAQRKAHRQQLRKRSREILERQRMQDYLSLQTGQQKMELTLLQDQSRFIERAVQEVLNSALLGAFFAVVVIYFFLRRFRPTVILCVSIPLSLVATFAPMFLSNIDMNIMSLGGLALGVGMLVDNSIVVLESIARQREQGKSRKEAAVLGVSRVASAVTASTLTTVAVFFPVVFVEGVAGQLFRDQALTVVYSLLLSLLVALFVIPMLASRGDGSTQQQPDEEQPGRFGKLTSTLFGTVVKLVVGAVLLVGALVQKILTPLRWCFDKVYGAARDAYPRVLRTALAQRALVVVCAIALLALAVWRAPKLGNELLPEVTQGELYVDAFLPRDATVERTDSVIQQVEREINGLAEVEGTFAACGVDNEELNDSDQGEHSARVLIRLRRHKDRKQQEDQTRHAVREILRNHPEVQSFRFARPQVLSFDAPVVVEVLGQDLLQLREACEKVSEVMAGTPGLRDVRSTLQRGNTELSIRLDREKMASLGLDSGQVAKLLQGKVAGDVPTLFAERERKIDMRVRLGRGSINNPSQLLNLNVNPNGNPPIPLASIAHVTRQEGPSEIRRIGSLRGAEVQATLAGFDLGSVQQNLALELGSLRLPRGISARVGGQKEEMERSLHSLELALWLAVFLVYIVMASQFESLVQPFVILMTLPLAFVGVVFMLELLTLPISVIVLLGAVVLAGIVVNNGIIMIDQINRLRADGRPKLEAIVEGAGIRLRPVLMTTLTTVLGLLPLTGWLTAGDGLELRAPLAITIITGLSVSTLLTLLVIPVVYSLSDRRV